VKGRRRPARMEVGWGSRARKGGDRGGAIGPIKSIAVCGVGEAGRTRGGRRTGGEEKRRTSFDLKLILFSSRDCFYTTTEK
jgi:hypothetical protein